MDRDWERINLEKSLLYYVTPCIWNNELTHFVICDWLTISFPSKNCVWILFCWDETYLMEKQIMWCLVTVKWISNAVDVEWSWDDDSNVSVLFFCSYRCGECVNIKETDTFGIRICRKWLNKSWIKDIKYGSMSKNELVDVQHHGGFTRQLDRNLYCELVLTVEEFASTLYIDFVDPDKYNRIDEINVDLFFYFLQNFDNMRSLSVSSNLSECNKPLLFETR